MPDKEPKARHQESEIARELRAAEREAETVSERHEHDKVMSELRSRIATAQK